MAGTSEGARKSAEAQKEARDARLAEDRKKLQDPVNVVGTDAYARANKLPPYDED